MDRTKLQRKRKKCNFLIRVGETTLVRHCWCSDWCLFTMPAIMLSRFKDISFSELVEAVLTMDERVINEERFLHTTYSSRA